MMGYECLMTEQWWLTQQVVHYTIFSINQHQHMHSLFKAANAAFAQIIGSGMEKSVTTSLLNGKYDKEVKIIVLLMAPDFLR